MTDEEFISWFSEAEKHIRIRNYKTYDNYYYGLFDNISMPKHIKDSLSTDIFLHANICKGIVDAKVQYILGSNIGITVESEEDLNVAAVAENKKDLPSNQAEKFLYDVYKSNGLLYRNMVKLLRILTKKGDVFIKISFAPKEADEKFLGGLRKLKFWRESSNNIAKLIKISIINPENVFPKYRDNDYEDMELCAVKYYEIDEKNQRVYRMQVWYYDRVQEWEQYNEQRGSSTITSWRRVKELPNLFGFIPIIHIANTIDDREYGVSDLHPVAEIQDIINKTITDLAITMDYQAFQRLFIIGAMAPPGKVWDISPGIITELPNPNAKIEVVPTADIKPYLEAFQQLREVGYQVAQTPMIALGKMEGGIPSGYALRIYYLPLENKCNEARVLVQEALQKLNNYLFIIAAKNGLGDWTNFDTKIQFRSGLPIDIDNLVKVHKEQIAMGTLSRETAMQEEGVQDVEIEQAKIKAEQFDIEGGALRATIEAEELQKRLNEELFSTIPKPSEAE